MAKLIRRRKNSIMGVFLLQLLHTDIHTYIIYLVKKVFKETQPWADGGPTVFKITLSKLSRTIWICAL